MGEGFRLARTEVEELGFAPDTLPPVIKKYQKGRQLLQGGDSGYVIDCYGLSAEEVRSQYPAIYQHLIVRVKPERDHNNRASRKKNWWLFGEPVGKLRAAVAELKRFIVTVETSTHKPFVFLPAGICPDHKLYAIAADDATVLGILSSHVHRAWALHAGGTLEDRPTWTNTTCFLPFPFPDLSGPLRTRICELGEQLDAHRKRQQSIHTELTLTGIYNVLNKLRAGQPLNAKEQVIHEQGLVSVLQQIHDDLDAAVFAAYGWPTNLTDEEILERLVALNAERAAEEARGIIRWLRPEFQAPNADAAKQGKLPLPKDDQAEPDKPEPAKKPKAAKTTKPTWPKERSQRSKAVQDTLAASPGPVTPEDLAKQFLRGKADQVEDVLEALCSLGMARRHRGKYTA